MPLVLQCRIDLKGSEVSKMWLSHAALWRTVTRWNFPRGATNTRDANPGLKSWTWSAFRLLLRHVAVTIRWLPVGSTSPLQSVAFLQIHVASACSLCLILSPPNSLLSLLLFLISPLECDLWWPWPALLGILHTWRDLNRALGPFHKGHSFRLA